MAAQPDDHRYYGYGGAIRGGDPPRGGACNLKPARKPQPTTQGRTLQGKLRRSFEEHRYQRPDISQQRHSPVRELAREKRGLRLTRGRRVAHFLQSGVPAGTRSAVPAQSGVPAGTRSPVPAQHQRDQRHRPRRVVAKEGAAQEAQEEGGAGAAQSVPRTADGGHHALAGEPTPHGRAVRGRVGAVLPRQERTSQPGLPGRVRVRHAAEHEARRLPHRPEHGYLRVPRGRRERAGE